VGSYRGGQARRSRWWQPRPDKRLVGGIGALALAAGMCLTPLAASTAGAASTPAGQLGPGSTHAILDAHDQLAMPIPRLASDFSVTHHADGSATVTFALTYAVANTRSSKRVRADDATITVRVARYGSAAGPSPADPVFTKSFVDNHLNRRSTTHHYSVTIPAAAVSFLKSKGLAFKKSNTGGTTTTAPSTTPAATKAMHLISVDVQQHRDFRRVDGSYDWTEGNFFTAASHPLATATTHSGTLTVTNETSQICTYANSGTVKNYGDPDTFNNCTSSNMATPVQLSGVNTECTDQDTDSDPAGFAQENSATVGVPEAPGAAITEPIVADDGASILSKDTETVDAGWAVTVGKVALTTAADVLAGGPFGTIIEAGLELSGYFSGTSCDNDPNVMTLSATDTTGAAGASYGWSMDEEGMQDVYGTNFADGNGGPLKAVQLAYSSQVYADNGTYQNPWLAEQVTRNCGVGNGTSACSTQTNSQMNVEWTSNDPCPSGQSYTFNGAPQAGNPKLCAETVPATPPVTDCGTNNSTCPSQTPPGPFAVPNVVGEPYSQAVSTLAAAGLGVYPTNLSATAIVTNQWPEGAYNDEPTELTPYVVQVSVPGSPPVTTTPPPEVTVPNVIGQEDCDAQSTLSTENLVLINETPDSRCATKVLTEVPAAGSKVAQRSQVDVTTTTPPPATTTTTAPPPPTTTSSTAPQGGDVPTVVGMTYTEAVATINAAGWRTTSLTTKTTPTGKIVYESPRGGEGSYSYLTFNKVVIIEETNLPPK
jgi:beta-lactam-binding protein with PASTA domain